MATAPIQYPRAYQAPGTSWLQQTAAQNNYTTDYTTYPFVAGQFVKLVSATLRPYVADDTVLYGLSLDASQTLTADPATAPFGVSHNPVALRGVKFIMNLTDGSGNVGSGSTTQGDVTVGSFYSARYLLTPYTSILAVDISDTGTATKNIFQVVGLVNTASGFTDGDASTDYNGRVVVQILATAIQS